MGWKANILNVFWVDLVWKSLIIDIFFMIWLQLFLFISRDKHITLQNPHSFALSQKTF